MYVRRKDDDRPYPRSANKIHFFRRGVRQGDVMSPKLFTTAQEDIFKMLNWGIRGINSEYISKLHFADDIVIFVRTLKKLGQVPK